MKAFAVVATASFVFVGGCSTVYIPPPQLPTRTASGTLSIKNDQVDIEPRIYFSDGISTYTTHYRGYTEVLLRAVGDRLASVKVADSATKSLSLSIQSIACTGHYIPDCTVSAVVATGNGQRRSLSGATSTGYPISSALDKAINGVAASIAGDPEVIAYLVR